MLLHNAQVTYKAHGPLVKNLLLQNQQAKFNQIWYKLSLDEGSSTLFK
jgi:hypothetical protein